jgi:hypothetical protein
MDSNEHPPKHPSEPPRRDRGDDAAGPASAHAQPAGIGDDAETAGGDIRNTDAERARANPGRAQAAMASGKLPGERAADDPGAVPLGTDEEAAGTPPPARAIDHEVERADQQRGRRGLTADQAMDGRRGQTEAQLRGSRRVLVIGAVVILLAIVLLLWLL